jgi:tetratricopeptide (TPR) repeat protein
MPVPTFWMNWPSRRPMRKPGRPAHHTERALIMTRLACLAVALLASTVGPTMATTPEDLPPPANQVMFMPDDPGEDIGLPLGATSAYAMGRSLYRDGDIEAALVYLNRAYRLAPKAELIALAYAQCLVDADYIGDAARVFGELVSAAPDSLQQRRQYAQLLAQSGRPRDALVQVKELERRGQADPELTKLHADLLGQLGRVDEAVSIYREAARRDPLGREDFLLAAASLLQRNERYDDMAEVLREGLEAEPASETMRTALVRFLVHRGDVDEARRQAAEGDEVRRREGVSSRPDCRLDLAETLARRGDFAAAAGVLQQARQQGWVDEDTDLQLVRYQLGQGDVEGALSILPDATARWSGNAELRYLWGRALDVQGDGDAALVRLREAVGLEPTVAVYRAAVLRLLVVRHGDALAAAEPTDEQAALRAEALEHAGAAAVSIHPRDADSHMIVGYTYRAVGDFDRAVRHFELAGEVAEARVPAMLEAGYTQQQAGRMDDARKTLHNLQREYPDDPEVANSYGYLLAELGENLEEAERLIRLALAAEPDNGAYLDSLGWVFYQVGRYGDAVDRLIAAVNVRPDDPVILEHLGLALQRAGQPAEARSALQRALAAGGDAERLQPLIEGLDGER